MSTSSSNSNGADFEPDDEWKCKLKQRVEDRFQSMTLDAKNSRQEQLKKGFISQATWVRLDLEYQHAMNDIRILVEEQYHLELTKERKARRCAVPPASIPATPSSNYKGANFESDDGFEWEHQLKEKIEDSLQSMIQDAKDSQQEQLKKGIVTRTTLERLDLEYKHAMNDIKVLAEELYQFELMKERSKCHWAVGTQMLPSRNDFLHEERGVIVNGIEQINHTDNSARTVSEGPTDERCTDRPPSSASNLQRKGGRDRGGEREYTLPHSYLLHEAQTILLTKSQFIPYRRSFAKGILVCANTCGKLPYSPTPAIGDVGGFSDQSYSIHSRNIFPRSRWSIKKPQG
jgi:hypothetical protein